MTDLIDDINMYPQFCDQTQIRLDSKINENKACSIEEIREREIMSTGNTKYNAAFDYFDKTLIVLSATNGGVSVVSFFTVIGAAAGIASASFSFAFSITTGIKKKLLKTI